jgi:hypothetical protein
MNKTQMIINKINEKLKRLQYRKKPILIKKKINCYYPSSHNSIKDSRCRIQINNKKIKIHRLVYETKFGKIPKNMCIMHKCDHPKCCNINHLKLGTKKDNMQDCVKKGRICRGIKQPNHKLTEKQIITIRKLSKIKIKKKYSVVYSKKIHKKFRYVRKYTMLKLSVMFDVNIVTIHDIIHGKLWKHIR